MAATKEVHVDDEALDSISDNDERELAALGKKSVLRRNFSPLAILGLSCSCVVTWEGLFSVFTFGLSNGGPAGLIYGFLLCWAGWAATVATMAELVSMWPTAGGQYHWTYMLAPEGWGRVLSYVTGWQSVIAWQAITASSSYLTATSFQGLIINSQPHYTPARWHGTLVIFALIFIAVLFATFFSRFFPQVETTVLFLHITLFIIVIVVLTVMSPDKSSNENVWTLFLQEGGYESKGITFMIGLITPIFAFSGADGAVHMSEEIRNSSRIVPWAMMWSIFINGITGFSMLIAFLYCMGSIPNALDTPTGYPFIEVLTQGSRSIPGGTALSSLLVFMFSCCTLSSLSTASRQLWAFARDAAVPNASYISSVHASMRVPVVSICVTATSTCLVSLINIGSATLFNAIVSLTVAGFFGSYLLPFSLFLYTRIKYPAKLKKGKWNLGPYGVYVNSFAVVWCSVCMFFSFWPQTKHVLPVDMNWSCVLWAAVVGFAVAFWWVHGRRVYRGPVVEVGVGGVREG